MVQTQVFVDYAQHVCVEVNAALQRYARLEAGCPQHLGDAIRHSLLAPGKRIRPLMVCMAAEACGGDCGRAIPAACAVEMIHTYSLIHDDLPAMDNAALRRGRPSCHAAFGEATAVLAGDALLAQAFEVLAEGVQPPEVAARCCRTLAQAAGAEALVGGQADDLEGEHTAIDLAGLESIHRRKTGALIRASLDLGALVGGGDGDQRNALSGYGDKIGLAFQIVDDLLDATGESADLGKPTGQDSDRGKRTFPALLGAEESRRRAEQLIHDACQAVRPFGDRAAVLESLAWYILQRTR